MSLRKTYSVLVFFASFVFFLFLAVCGTRQTDMREKTVASVGEEKITVRDVRELFGVRSATHEVFGVAKERKRDALDRLIAGKLLAAESRKRGYDKSEDFKKRYDDGEKDLYIAVLFKEKVDQEVKVGDGEIQAEVKKLLKEDEKLSQEEALKRATETIYQNTFKERDNILVRNVKENLTKELHDDDINRIVSGDDVADDTTVAEINGTPVSYGDVKKALSTVGGHGKENLNRDPRAISAIVERISIQLGLYDYAKREQVDKSANFKRVKDNFESSILIDLLINNDIRKGVDVSDKEVKKTYDEHPEMFETNAKVGARHILVDDEQMANEIYDKIQGGADFQDMAKQFSKDPSAAKGGDLGNFGRGVMVKPFEEAAFSMKVGEISKPVKTQFGYHIIQVTEKEKGETIPFAQAKNRIKKFLLDKRMNAEIESLISKLKENAVISVNEVNLDLV